MKRILLADADKKLLLKKDIVAKYGIPHNTLSIIVKNREKIESLTSSDQQPERKRQRKYASADVDRALFLWFKQARSIHAPISGPIMQTQAELIDAELGNVDFKASSGRLDRFKRRHGIVYKTVWEIEVMKTDGKPTAPTPFPPFVCVYTSLKYNILYNAIMLNRR